MNVALVLTKLPLVSRKSGGNPDTGRTSEPQRDGAQGPKQVRGRDSARCSTRTTKGRHHTAIAN